METMPCVCVCGDELRRRRGRKEEEE